MKSFATFFTAIALTLIPSVWASANESHPASVTPSHELSTSQGKFDLTGIAAQQEENAKKVETVREGRTVVTSDFGGSVLEYIQKYNRWNLEGRKVKVNDDCMSACTFMIGRLPKENVCVSETAQFAFHSAYQMTFAGPVFASEATRLMWQYYPKELQEKLRSLGWDGPVEHPEFIYIKGTELYEQCNT